MFAQCLAAAIVRQLCAQSRHALAQSSMPPIDSQLLSQASHTSAQSVRPLPGAASTESVAAPSPFLRDV